MRRSRLSLTTFVFGLLALTTAAYAVPLFYANFSLYSAMVRSVRESGMAADAVAELSRAMGLSLLFFVVVLTATLLVATVLLFKRVIVPIKRLDRAFAELRAGDLHARVEPEGLTEIRHIGEDFNEATRTVRERTDALGRATAELREAHGRLEKEYVEVKKLNDLMVGRELAMVKMKEEMGRLKAELARKNGS